MTFSRVRPGLGDLHLGDQKVTWKKLGLVILAKVLGMLLCRYQFWVPNICPEKGVIAP